MGIKSTALSAALFCAICSASLGGGTQAHAAVSEWTTYRAAPNTWAQLAVLDGAGVAASRELSPDEQIEQALSRLTFGARPGDSDRVRSMGVDKWIALQLHPEQIDDPATEQLVARYDMLRTPTSEIVKLFRDVRQKRRQAQRMQPAGDSTEKRDIRERILRQNPGLRDASRRLQSVTSQVQSAKVARAVSSERQLQEVMVDFWENHFSVFAGKGQTRVYLAAYDRDAIRPNAMGKFRDLLGAVAQSPAMLFYLDNWQSAADSGQPRLRRPARRSIGIRAQAAQQRARGLNENYARELMELHTLGADGGYTQQDVIEVARALTGWSIDPRNGQFVFRPALHDAGPKTVLGHKLQAGRGIEDGEQVLDILAAQPATARFVATKLVVHFVSDSAPAALVERVAQTYMRTSGDIREMMHTIVTSPEFFSTAAYHAKVKTPFEFAVSALRAIDAAPDTTARTARAVARLGQPIFGRQTPDGWPDRADAWMNTGAILNRINFAQLVAAGRLPGVKPHRGADAKELALRLGGPDFQRR